MWEKKRKAAVCAFALACLVSLIGGGPRAWAYDIDLAAETERVRRAFADGDADGLRALADRAYPDPWLVAAELVADGDLDAALALAGASDRPEVQGLSEWLRGREEDLVAVAHIQAQVANAESLLRQSDLLASAEAFVEAARFAARIGWRAAQADALYEAGSSLYGYGNVEEALALFERRLAVEEELGSEIGVGRSHFGIALALRALARAEEAEVHLKRAYELCTKAGDQEYLAKLVAEEAYDHARAGRHAAALADFDRALDLLDQADPSRWPTRFRASALRLARTRGGFGLNAASMAAELGDVAAWRLRTDDALTAARASSDARLILRARAQKTVAEGVFAERSGAHADAAEAYEKALGLYGQLQDRFGTVQTLRRLGGVTGNLGRLPRALDIHEQALSLASDIGAEHERTRAMMEIGSLKTRMGRFSEGHVHLHCALDLSRQLGNRRLEAYVLARFGSHYSDRADYGTALARYEEALSVQATTNHDRETGAILLGLANTRRRLGEHDRALALYEEAGRRLEATGDDYRASQAIAGRAALRIAQGEAALAEAEIRDVLVRERERGNACGVAEALFLLGNVHVAAGRPEAALECFLESRELRRASRDVTRAIRATLNVAYARMWLGQTGESERELAWALGMADDLESRELRAFSRSYVGLHNLRLGKNAEALRWSRLAASDARHLGLDLGGGQAARARAQYADVYMVGALAATRLADPESLFFFLESGRSATLLRELGEDANGRLTAVSERLRDAEADARMAEARALAIYQSAQRRGKLTEMRAARATLHASREAHATVIQAIEHEQQASAQGAYPAPAHLTDVRGALASDEALILYGVPDEEVVALVVTRDAARIVELGGVDRLTAAVDAVLLQEAPFVDPAAAGPLQAELIAPLGLDEDVRRVLVSPVGPMAHVPLTLLAGEREVVCVPSATTWMRLGEASPTRGDAVLAFGNPNYDAPRTGVVARLRAGEVLISLPGTEEEARAVGDVVRVGAQATETRFREEIAGGEAWRAVHFACHGVIDTERPGLSALALGADAENDGYLTAIDVLRLEIPAELAVLSGCETGKGKAVRGEGIMGLTHAFIAAGVPAVLVSLWPVDDEATQMFMTAFYEAWNPDDGTEGAKAAQALRMAQVAVRSDPRWRHPRHWAGWSLWGRPQE